MPRWFIIVILGFSLMGCSNGPAEWAGRQITGLDCRPEKVDARGHCVATR